MSRKNSFEYVKQYFTEHGCELLETEYVGAKNKMKYKCSCGNISEITFNKFKSGQRCKACAIEKSKHSFEYVKQYFTEHNCELSETKYVNSHTKMKYKCSCGNISETSFVKFKNGQRCRACANEKMKHSFEYVRQYFTEHGCELLETEYVGAHNKMKYKCFCGNISEITFGNFKNGHRCMICLIKNQSGVNSHFWNPDRQQVIFNYNFRNKCNKLVRYSFHGIKKDETEIRLGYSSQDLMTHIHSHPNWKKVKNKKWNFDHIFPISAFIKYCIFDFKIVNALDNLQPLSQNENCLKHDKYNREDFENWLISKGVLFTSQIALRI